jgi:ABC-type Zn2+ transport system substrate-binding protein/surface adhesin
MLVRASGNCDRGAVHVHYPIADMIESCPGQCVFAEPEVSNNSAVESVVTGSFSTT